MRAYPRASVRTCRRARYRERDILRTHGPPIDSDAVSKRVNRFPTAHGRRRRRRCVSSELTNVTGVKQMTRIRSPARRFVIAREQMALRGTTGISTLSIRMNFVTAGRYRGRIADSSLLHRCVARPLPSSAPRTKRFSSILSLSTFPLGRVSSSE